MGTEDGSPLSTCSAKELFQGLLTNKPMGTGSKLMEEMAPAAGQVRSFPLHPGSLPPAHSGPDERSQQKMVCTLTQQEFPSEENLVVLAERRPGELALTAESSPSKSLCQNSARNTRVFFCS